MAESGRGEEYFDPQFGFISYGTSEKRIDYNNKKLEENFEDQKNFYKKIDPKYYDFLKNE